MNNLGINPHRVTILAERSLCQTASARGFPQKTVEKRNVVSARQPCAWRAVFVHRHVRFCVGLIEGTAAQRRDRKYSGIVLSDGARHQDPATGGHFHFAASLPEMCYQHDLRRVVLTTAPQVGCDIFSARDLPLILILVKVFKCRQIDEAMGQSFHIRRTHRAHDRSELAKPLGRISIATGRKPAARGKTVQRSRFHSSGCASAGGVKAGSPTFATVASSRGELGRACQRARNCAVGCTGAIAGSGRERGCFADARHRSRCE